MKTYRLQSFSGSSLPDSFIKDHLTLAELDKIKSKITKPFLKAWTVLHEGVAKAFDIETGSDIEIEYSKDVVKSAPAIAGLEFFEGHNKDNSKDNRPVIGYVVKEIQIEQDGKLQKVAIGAFEEDKKSIAERSDIVSPEFGASFMDHLSNAGRFIAKQIGDISAIALGDSSKDTPGFPGATQIAALQAFKNQNLEEKKMPTREEILTVLNTDIVREWMNKNPSVHIGMIAPEDRFMPDWHEDPTTKRGHFKNGEKTIRKALNDILDQRYKAEEKIQVLESEKTEFQKEKTRIEAIPSVISFIESKNFPDTAKAILTEQIQKLDLEKYTKDRSSAIKEYIESVMDKELESISRWQGKEVAEKKKAEWFADKQNDPSKQQTTTKEKKPSYHKPGTETEDKDEVSDWLPEEEG
ncbi:hypothetical protein LPTSP2_37930 [Leptospira ellinghausenii]|uniref:Uncharacterized protein n=1 Tax=Leptospira ellinghausenii TaxID=1917822 RepID=A0A2P2DIT6_9LEPT|nr:hypothetical protein [Leptospira ellinghausenii]GBF44490.1 hypothetical protein LPTSP2_37930 [Leptospira ellinghausenii]